MTFPALLALAITIVAAGLLLSEKIRADLVALLVLVTLSITGLVSGPELFSGFSGSAVITILSISIISEGLHQTGVTHLLGAQMHRFSGKNESRLIVAIMLTAAGLSLFMNNIAAVGVLLPAVMSLTRQSQVAPSRLMMPLAYGTSLGGMATLLTTSNIIVSGALRDAGYAQFQLLDFLPIGALVILVGLLYMVFVGRRLLPHRYPAGQAMRSQVLHKELARLYGLESNLVEIEVTSASRLAHLSISQGKWASAIGANIVGLSRNGQVRIAPSRREVIRPGDILLVQGSPDQTRLTELGLVLRPHANTALRFADETVSLVEVVLSPHTTLIGKTLRDAQFRDRFHLNVLAIWRGGTPLSADLADVQLEFGDALLVQGSPARIHLLHAERDLIVLEEDPDAVLKPKYGRRALIITLVTLGIAAAGWFPVAEVTMAGAVVMLLSGCLEMNDAYRAIEWKAIFLIAGMWPLSIAIRSSGLADAAVAALIAAVGSVPPLVMAAVLIGFGFLLTQFMGGQVAALVVAPLAISAAVLTNTDPRAMGMAVALACSLAFPTPFGHPVNVMVMGSGGYTFKDFARVGLPLTGLIIAVIMFGLHFFWGL